MPIIFVPALVTVGVAIRHIKKKQSENVIVHLQPFNRQYCF